MASSDDEDCLNRTDLCENNELSDKPPDEDSSEPHEGFQSTEQAVNHSLLIVNNRLSGIGFQLWPAARVLCKFIDETCHRKLQLVDNPCLPSIKSVGYQLKPVDCFVDWSRVRACELGAGCGLVSMFVASLGCSVTVTDLPMILPHLRTNILANPSLFIPDESCSDNMSFKCNTSDGSIHIAPLSWGDVDMIKQSQIDMKYDLLLLSDCVYWEDLFDPLLITLRTLMALNPSCKIWMAQSPRRAKVESRFFKAARKHFDVSIIGAMKHHPTDRQMVTIYQFTTRSAINPK